MSDHVLYIRNTLEVAGETSSPSPKDDATEEHGMPRLQQTDTFDSSTAEGISLGRHKQTNHGLLGGSIWTYEDLLFHVVYISLFAMLGTSLRIFLGRLFGLDCVLAETGNPVGDFFEDAKLCITSDGKSGKGGSVFIDLPANMLGALFMGIISQRSGPRIPWLSYDHPLQQNSALHVGFTVGFCGCLTTFASWNTQMVVMMDGSDTSVGPQVGQAAFGYLIGITCCIASFLFGRLLGCCRQNDRGVATSADSVAGAITEEGTQDRTHDQSIDIESAAEPPHPLSQCCTMSFILPFLFISSLLAAYIVGDAAFALPFYRGTWMATLVSPFGALLRWRLSTLNSGPRNRWFPWGTFTANVVASVLSVASDALQSNIAGGTGNNVLWVSSLLLAIEVGFAGSLSTVSTMVRELCSWKKAPWKSVLYFLATVLTAVALSIAVYSPVIRAG